MMQQEMYIEIFKNSRIYEYIYDRINVNLIRIPSRTDTTLTNLIPNIESKLGIKWNRDPILNESTNLGM